jgi:hypothetical protein
LLDGNNKNDWLNQLTIRKHQMFKKLKTILTLAVMLAFGAQTAFAALNAAAPVAAGDSG